jgi:hypothetical protein
MRRHILGISALLLLIGAIVFRIWPPVSAGGEGLHAACTRVGALCAVLWLAYRELERLPAWLGSVIPVAAILVALRPKWAIIAIPMVFALMILGRKKKVDPRRG